MTEQLVLTLQWLLVLNPLGTTLYWRSVAATDDATGDRKGMLAGSVAATVLLVLAVLLGDDIIDALDISPPNWRIAAGVLLILGSLHAFVSRNPFAGTHHEGHSSPDWLPAARLALWLAGPPALGVAIAHGVDRGAVRAVAAIVVAVLAVLAVELAQSRWSGRAGFVAAREAARLTAVGAVVLALRLIMDGVDGV
jgi:small neutral amino acid transporter SnatA (MarC family)